MPDTNFAPAATPAELVTYTFNGRAERVPFPAWGVYHKATGIPVECSRRAAEWLTDPVSGPHFGARFLNSRTKSWLAENAGQSARMAAGCEDSAARCRATDPAASKIWANSAAGWRAWEAWWHAVLDADALGVRQ